MSSMKPNKNTALATDQKAIQGVDKHFAKIKSLVLAGVSYTPASLKALFQAEIDACNALDQSRAQMKEQVATTRTARANASAGRKNLKAYVLGNYGANAVQVLEDFGLSVPKASGPKTVEAKAGAILQAKATRKARNTMGKRQKLSVTGAPSTAAPAEAPAQVAPASPPAQVAATAASSTPSH